MIQFTINQKEYTIKEPTIREYYKVQNLFVNTETTAKMQIVSELSGCKLDELKKLSNTEFNLLWSKVVETHLTLDSNKTLYQNFEFSGSKYCFIDIEKLSVGEFADMEVFKSDINSQKNLHTMLAVLYRPAVRSKTGKLVAEDYDTDTLKERAELFMDLPLKYVYSALNFFLKVPELLCESTLSSLVSEATSLEEKEMLEEMKQLMLLSLDPGTQSSSIALETMSQKLVKLNDLALSLYSTTSPTEMTRSRRKRTDFDNFVQQIQSESTRMLSKIRSKK